MSGQKKKSGGKRKGAGAPLKYGEPLKKTTMEFPESKVQEIKKKIRDSILVYYIVKK